MNQLTIVSGAASQASLGQAILDRWPRPEERPALCESTPDALLRGTLQHATALVAAPAGADEAAVRRLATALVSAGGSGVILVDGPLGLLRAQEIHGVVVEPASASPDYLAATLFALSRRQVVVDDLESEVRHLRVSSGGLAGQMTQWHQEMHLAASVQRELLPRELPLSPGLSAAVLFRPAGYVSGDIYDVSELPDGRIGYFIADAVGHGVPAALLTMVIGQSLKRTVEGASGTRVVEPADALRHLNESLCGRQFHSPRFATAVYAVVDPNSGHVTIAGAGHPAALRMTAAGILHVESEGPLLGVFPDGEFAQASFTLEAGETLLLYSDGFETAFPNPRDPASRKPNQAYIDHMARLLGPRSEAPLGDAMRQLEALLDEQSGSLHQADDLTALAIHREPVAARLAVAQAA